jgi:hypothetical protein
MTGVSPILYPLSEAIYPIQPSLRNKNFCYLGFFAQTHEKVYSRDDTRGTSSGVTATGPRWNARMGRKCQAFIPPRYACVNRRSRNSEHACAETIGFLCLISGLMIQRPCNLINAEISATYETVPRVILEVYFRNIPFRGFGQKTP